MDEQKAKCWRLGLICVFYFGFIFFAAGVGLLAGGVSSKDSEYTDGETMIIFGALLLPIGLIIMIAGCFCCRHVIKKRRQAFQNAGTVQGGPTVTGTVPMGQVGSVQPYGQSEPFSQPQPYGQHYSQPQGYNSFSAPASAPPPPSYADVTKR